MAQPSFFSDEKAISITEYALLLGVIAIISIAAVSSVGVGVNQLFNDVGTNMDDVAASSAAAGTAEASGGSGGSGGGSGGGGSGGGTITVTIFNSPPP